MKILELERKVKELEEKFIVQGEKSADKDKDDQDNDENDKDDQDKDKDNDDDNDGGPPGDDKQIGDEQQISTSGEASVGVEQAMVLYTAPTQALDAEPMYVKPIRMFVGGDEGVEEEDLTEFMKYLEFGEIESEEEEMIPRAKFELCEEEVEIEEVKEGEDRMVDTIEYEYDFDEPVIEEWVDSETEEEPKKSDVNVPESSIPRDIPESSNKRQTPRSPEEKMDTSQWFRKIEDPPAKKKFFKVRNIPYTGEIISWK